MEKEKEEELSLIMGAVHGCHMVKFDSYNNLRSFVYTVHVNCGCVSLIKKETIITIIMFL